MRGILAVVVVSLAVGAGPAADLSTEVVDQQSLPGVNPSVVYAAGGPVEQVLSQTVTAGITGRLVEVRFAIACEGGQVSLEVRDVDAQGQPGPTRYFHRRYPARFYPTPLTDSFQTLSVGGSLDFTAGDRFAIVITNIGGSCGVWPGEVGDFYSGGTAWADANDGPIVPLSLGSGRDDLAFQTVMRTR